MWQAAAPNQHMHGLAPNWASPPRAASQQQAALHAAVLTPQLARCQLPRRTARQPAARTLALVLLQCSGRQDVRMQHQLLLALPVVNLPQPAVHFRAQLRVTGAGGRGGGRGSS